MALPSESTAKGRAVTARPFVLLGFVIAIVLAVPSLAQATLLPPLLTESNPVSPGALTAPRIKGQVEEEVIKAAPFGATAFEEPITNSSEPNNTVTLYTDPSCTGSVAATGTVEQLEEPGIQVTVGAESTTTFYGIQNNATETSGCSPQGFSYRQVSSAPSAPAFSSVSPASPANYNFPYLIGSADPEATVSIYAGVGCSGSPVASGSGAAFAAPGIQVAVADNSETSFYARAAIAGFTSVCSATPIVYREVTPPPTEVSGGGGSPGGGGVAAPPATPPPAPHLRTVPGGTGNDTTPTLTGSAPGAAAVKLFAGAACSGAFLAKVPVSSFAVGVELQVAENAAAAFSAISVSISGRESGCSDPVTYLEDSTAPHTRITMGPAAKTAKRKATFRFIDTTGDAAGTVFLCKVDAAKWKRCSSPLSLRHLHPRRHVVRVKAVDPAGNAEPAGAKRQFKVIRHP
ncbi:MAG TPA: hypothetical protein VLL27_06295 [Solirubrobacterales bacterium]|nr:hypothetical protein [Solirubrobacterales bacterium]